MTRIRPLPSEQNPKMASSTNVHPENRSHTRFPGRHSESQLSHRSGFSFGYLRQQCRRPRRVRDGVCPCCEGVPFHVMDSQITDVLGTRAVKEHHALAVLSLDFIVVMFLRDCDHSDAANLPTDDEQCICRSGSSFIPMGRNSSRSDTLLSFTATIHVMQIGTANTLREIQASR